MTSEMSEKRKNPKCLRTAISIGKRRRIPT
jgi:hypothetical protein